MEEFRHLGEVIGGLKALMVLKEEIQINQRQCILLFDILTTSFETISEEIKQNLLLEEKNTKWKSLVHPLRDLHKIFKEGEIYIRSCLDFKNWWGRAISLHNNNDCVEFHIHNLLSSFPTVIDSIEAAGDLSGVYSSHKSRPLLDLKYSTEWVDPKLFQWRFGKQYLVPRATISRFDKAMSEDRWLLSESLREKVESPATRSTKILGSLLLDKMNSSEIPLFPISVLLESKDYAVRRRLGSTSHYREVQWLGESFVLRRFTGEAENLPAEIRTLLSLTHPNITRYYCGFQEDNDFFLLMELMEKDLSHCIKEKCGSRKQSPFSIPVAVDIMLQVARGMEHLHSKDISHGGLTPSAILVKSRPGSSDGYLSVKLSGFGLPSVSRNHEVELGQRFISRAPEVLDRNCCSKFTEKSDVYSFGMVCFEVLTGKVPFEEGHLQGDKMGRNIRAGERPLFPFSTPKYLAGLIKRCWHEDPSLRPRFSSLCRILRHISRSLVARPEDGVPHTDLFETEAAFVERHGGDEVGPTPVCEIPFQAFAYRVVERERTRVAGDENSDECQSEAAATASLCGDDDRRSVCSEVIVDRPTSLRNRRSTGDMKVSSTKTSGGMPRSQQSKRSPLGTCNGSVGPRVGSRAGNRGRRSSGSFLP